MGQELLTHKEHINSYLVFHGVNVVCISIIILGVLSHIGIIRAPDNVQVQRVITPYF